MRLLRGLGIVLAALLALAALLYAVADSNPGRRFIVDRIESLRPANGLRIRIGRIDGSIYGRSTIRDLQLFDSKGLFFEAPRVALDWRPFAWARNRLDINSVTAPRATLVRVPALEASTKGGPILPGFDIRVGRLAIDRLVVGKAVTGQERIGSLTGNAEVVGPRARINLRAAVDGGDRLALFLDSEPDRDRFDLEADVSAPAGGVLGKLTGIDQPFTLRAGGQGSWRVWRGRLNAAVAGRQAADLALAVDRGVYRLTGQIAPRPLLAGRVADLLSPIARVDAAATLTNRRADTKFALASDALALTGRGVVDLGGNRLKGMVIDARLKRPAALIPSMRGDNVRLRLMLDGVMASPRFDYLLTADRAAFDATGFEAVRVSGQGRWTEFPVTVPVKLSARRVTGVGDVAGGLLNNLTAEGALRFSPTLVTGDNILVRSDKLNGRISVMMDLATGRYDFGVSGRINRYLIPGLGIVDIRSDMKVRPVPGGGVRIAGLGEVWVRRLDNAFLRNLAGGLPYIVTELERGGDGLIHFRNLRIRAPALALSGQGYRRLDGSFYFTGQGTQRQYGPVSIVLDGPISRPRVDLKLARPLDAAGLRGVSARLVPTAAGFDWSASGQSRLGPFRGRGAILLPRGGQTVVRIGELNVSGMRASGDLRLVPGGADGLVRLAGNGVNGTLRLFTRGGVQGVDANLNARNASFAGPPQIAARSAVIDATFMLDPAGLTMEGTVQANGLAYGNISLARLNATGRIVGGRGQIRALVAGTRGRAFDLQTIIDVAPNRYAIQASGTVDRRPLVLNTPAVLTREGGAWRLAPVQLSYAGGRATLAGVLGGRTQIDAQLSQMPLDVLNIINPELGLGGVASGTLRYADSAAGPTGEVRLRIRNLRRQGLVLSAKPVDAGVNAILDRRGVVGRAVLAAGGTTVGQAQLRLGPLTGGGGLMAQMRRASLTAQLRYNGAAEPLWRLAAIPNIEVSGPVAIGADVTGTLDRPDIRGSMRTQSLRIESALSGTVLTNLRSVGTFSGSRLDIPSFIATAGPGTVRGRASFDLGAASGFAMAIDARAQNAELIRRDDVGATVTGPLTLRSDAGGGLIRGRLALDKSYFRLGSATSRAAIPQLNVREINGRSGQAQADTPAAPRGFALDIMAQADSRLMVTGLGLDSEWSTDLKIGGTLSAMKIAGRADVVRGGYEFAGKRFDLERGVIRFTGDGVMPLVDILAQTEVDDLEATVRVTGSATNPDIAFSSVPALPQEELLSRLLFGTSVTTLSAPEAFQLAAAVASLRGGAGDGLNPINALRKAIGLDRLRIIQTDAAAGSRTAIAAGKYLTRRTFVEVISDGQGYAATRVEFRVTRWLALLATLSTIGRTTAAARISRDY